MNGKILMFLSLAIMLAVMATGVYAATADQTFLSPTASTRISGATFEVRVEVNGTRYKCESGVADVCTMGTNLSGVNISYTRTQPTSGSKTQWCNNLSNVNNGTVTNYTMNCDTALLEDVGTYTITVDVRNGTATLNTTTVATITVDNFVPSTTFGTLTPTAGQKLKRDSFTIDTIANINASACTLYVNNKIYTIDRSYAAGAETCSKALSRMADGKYSVYWVNTDALNTSTGTARSFELQAHLGSVGDTAKGKAQEAVVQTRRSLNPLIFLFGFLAFGFITTVMIVIWKTFKR